jgi:hypothetical protein
MIEQIAATIHVGVYSSAAASPSAAISREEGFPLPSPLTVTGGSRNARGARGGGKTKWEARRGGAGPAKPHSSARNSFLRAGWPCCWGVDSKLLEEGKSGSCRAGLECSQSLAGLGAWRSRFAVWAAAGRSETEIRTRLAGGPGATRTSTVFILFPRR